MFYDEDYNAHKRYKLDVDKGTVFVLRLDGYLGVATKLGSGGAMAFG